MSGERLGRVLDWWESSERRVRLRERLTAMDGVDPDDVIMAPAEARRRGLTSTVTFPRGNLAPEGSVIKSTAIDPSVVDADGVYRKTGPARVFTRERDAIAAIKSQKPDRLKPGDILVLICRGPLGAGMEEIYQITAALRHLSWGKQVAVLTDARFSGVSTGACIGHVGPEALAGGPIGAVRDGDTIQIVVDRNRLEGSVDLVGEGDARFSPEQGARVLAARAPRPDLAADPDIAGGHAAVGGAAASGRRNVGRVRVRRGRDHPRPRAGQVARRRSARQGRARDRASSAEQSAPRPLLAGRPGPDSGVPPARGSLASGRQKSAHRAQAFRHVRMMGSSGNRLQSWTQRSQISTHKTPTRGWSIEFRRRNRMLVSQSSAPSSSRLSCASSSLGPSASSAWRTAARQARRHSRKAWRSSTGVIAACPPRAAWPA